MLAALAEPAAAPPPEDALPARLRRLARYAELLAGQWEALAARELARERELADEREALERELADDADGAAAVLVAALGEARAAIPALRDALRGGRERLLHLSVASRARARSLPPGPRGGAYRELGVGGAHVDVRF